MSNHDTHIAKNKLKQAILLGLLILIVEIIGGIMSNSLALYSDAFHMLTDVASLIIAYFAVKLSTNKPNKNMTFGYYRISILAAVINAFILVAIAFFIGIEAYHRLFHPQKVKGIILFITATVGLIINLYIGLGMRSQKHNINIKTAMIHVLGDAAASFGVIIAGIIMYFTNWYIVDPILSFLIALLVAVSAIRVLIDTYYILMEATPKSINFDQVIELLKNQLQTRNMHDLHIWTLSSNHYALSCHIKIEGNLSIKETQVMLMKLEKELNVQFKISHVTIQFEDINTPHSDQLFSLDEKKSSK